MNNKMIFPPQPGNTPIQPPTPIVYVKEKHIWKYKQLVRNLAKETAPTEDELNVLGAEGWELAGMFTDSPFVYLYFKRLAE
jgi:hypothetical protein